MAKQEYPSKGTYLFYRFIETDKTFNEVIDIINGSKDFIPDADAALLKLNVLRESCKQAHLALYANHDSINMVNIGFNDLSPLTDDVAVECNDKYIDLSGPERNPHKNDELIDLSTASTCFYTQPPSETIDPVVAANSDKSVEFAKFANEATTQKNWVSPTIARKEKSPSKRIHSKSRKSLKKATKKYRKMIETDATIKTIEIDDDDDDDKKPKAV